MIPHQKNVLQDEEEEEEENLCEISSMKLSWELNAAVITTLQWSSPVHQFYFLL